MKKTFAFALLVLFFASCGDKKKIPDVSGIKVDLSWQRFDQDFFAIDSNHVLPGLNQLDQQYPLMTPLFLQNVLGVDSAGTLEGVKHFLGMSQLLKDTIARIFHNTEELKKDFRKAFQFVKYYFPDYKLPAIVTIAGPVDAMAQSDNGPTPDFLRPGLLGISLQFYLGRNFSVYHDPFFIDNVAPEYRSRRFSKEYIVSDAAQLIVSDLYPDQSRGKSLVEQMIEKGKAWWLLDKFLPTTADSVKTGYTQDQLDWCAANEGLIWTYILKNENLYSVDPSTIQVYIGEGPFTQGFSQELSPGNIGQWIGWQIVKKYADNNPKASIQDIMTASGKKILDEAKYRPK